MDTLNSQTLWQIGGVALLLFAFIGLILGLADVVVVFRNYDDLGIVFLITLAFFGTCFLVIFYGQNGGWFKPVVLILGCAVTLCLTIYTLIRTWRDNPNWLMPFAAITKLALGMLFVFYLFDLISPSGKSVKSRAKSRAMALVVLTILTPIISKLVKSKTGLFSPKEVFNQYQRGRLKL